MIKQKTIKFRAWDKEEKKMYYSDAGGDNFIFEISNLSEISVARFEE